MSIARIASARAVDGARRRRPRPPTAPAVPFAASSPAVSCSRPRRRLAVGGMHRSDAVERVVQGRAGRRAWSHAEPLAQERVSWRTSATRRRQRRASAGGFATASASICSICERPTRGRRAALQRAAGRDLDVAPLRWPICRLDDHGVPQVADQAVVLAHSVSALTRAYASPSGSSSGCTASH